ncbi:MAG: acetate--CoA ligase family protein [Firmicutes bacterium]|nr:acetate--CoA ligase family protein [Bacillota bacterium]
MNLDALFTPRGVAVYGSVKPGKMGAILIDRLVEGGYSPVYAVNPKAESYRDAQGYDSILKIEDHIDCVIIASPAKFVAGVLEDAGKKGVKGAVIITSGFSEAGYHDLEDEMDAIAQKYGIRYIGPNCAGMVNTKWNFMPTLESTPNPGKLAVISQSGAVGGLIMGMSKEANVGVSKFVSFGNGRDLNAAKLLRYFKDDPDTAVISLYAENIAEGREFMKLLAETTKTKPVIIIKSGRTASGQRAALSHTGSLAGADTVYDAAFAACGAIRADSIEDMLDISKAFCQLPEAKGNRMAIVTNSGGPGVMSADASEHTVLTLPEPSAALKDKLREFLPAFAGLANPIDLTVEGTPEQYGKAIETALQDEYDVAVVIDIGTPYLEATPIAQEVVRAAKAVGKPVVSNFKVGNDIDQAMNLLDTNGAPCFASAERAVRALSKVVEYSQLKAKVVDMNRTFETKEIKTDLPSLLEYEANDLCYKYGVSVNHCIFVDDKSKVKAACEELGFPIVLKIVSPQILHKSDVGGVKVNIKSVEEAEEYYDKMEKIGEGKDFRGCVLYHMIDQSIEMIVGFSTDKQFGPVVICGMGGIYTEILKDVSLRIAPVTETQAMEMLKELKTWPLLNGARGGKHYDVEALAKLVAKFSELPFVYPQLKEGEFNPVFIYEKGAMAADCRMILK